MSFANNCLQRSSFFGSVSSQKLCIIYMNDINTKVFSLEWSQCGDLHNNRYQKIGVYKFYRLCYESKHKAFWMHRVFERDWIAVFKNAWKCECADSPAGAWMWCMDTLLSSEWFWMWYINRWCIGRHSPVEEVMAPFHRMLITLLSDDELV